MIQDCQAPRKELMLKETPRVGPSPAEEVRELTLRALFEAEESRLLRYAYSLTGRRAVAEEIVQDVFLQLHVHWDTVEAPRAWLLSSVRNRAYNHLRNSKRESLHGDDSETKSPSVDGETPEATLLRMEMTGALRELIDELNETDRQLVTLKYFQNLKYRDISAQTGLSISNVGYRLHHILKELAGKLGPLGFDRIS